MCHIKKYNLTDHPEKEEEIMEVDLENSQLSQTECEECEEIDDDETSLEWDVRPDEMLEMFFENIKDIFPEYTSTLVYREADLDDYLDHYDEIEDDLIPHYISLKSTEPIPLKYIHHKLHQEGWSGLTFEPVD